MTAAPRDPYEWIDTASLDPDFWLMKRESVPRVLPQRHTQRPSVTMYATHALTALHVARRQRVLDQAVRAVFAEMYPSGWERRFYRRYASDVGLVPYVWALRINAEFARLWSDESPCHEFWRA